MHVYRNMHAATCKHACYMRNFSYRDPKCWACTKVIYSHSNRKCMNIWTELLLNKFLTLLCLFPEDLRWPCCTWCMLLLIWFDQSIMQSVCLNNIRPCCGFWLLFYLDGAPSPSGPWPLGYLLSFSLIWYSLSHWYLASLSSSVILSGALALPKISALTT